MSTYAPKHAWLTTNRKAAGAEVKWQRPGERANHGTEQQCLATTALLTPWRSRWPWQPWDDVEGHTAPTLRERDGNREGRKTDNMKEAEGKRIHLSKTNRLPVRTWTPWLHTWLLLAVIVCICWFKLHVNTSVSCVWLDTDAGINICFIYIIFFAFTSQTWQNQTRWTTRIQ